MKRDEEDSHGAEDGLGSLLIHVRDHLSWRTGRVDVLTLGNPSGFDNGVST